MRYGGPPRLVQGVMASKVQPEGHALLHALASNSIAQAAELCTPEEAAKCGPGNLSALVVALLADTDELLLQLLAAGAPLDVTLSLHFLDSELSSWIAASGLRGRQQCQQHLKAGRSALELALALGKPPQACLLMEAGAALEGLLLNGPPGCKPYAQAAQQALAHYTQGYLQAATPRLFAQVARLALVAGPGVAPCLRVLQLAEQQNVSLASEDAERLVVVTAKPPGWREVALHVVQRCPNSVWPLLLARMAVRADLCIRCMSPSLAAKLFPMLAKKFAGGALTLPTPACKHLAALVLVALEMGCERPCLSALGMAEQQQVALLPEDTFSLLRKAAAGGYTKVAMLLLRAGTGLLLWRLLIPEPGEDLCKRVHPKLAPALFSYLLQQVKEGQLELRSSPQFALLLRYAVAHSRPTTCLEFLKAAMQQQVLVSAEEAGPVLQLATGPAHGHVDVVMQLLEAVGNDAVWQLIPPLCLGALRPCRIHPTVAEVLLPHLAEQVAAGALPVDTCKLTRLVRTALDTGQLDAATRVLQAAQRSGIQPSNTSAAELLRDALSLCGLAAQQLAGLLLAAKPDLSSPAGSMIIVQAAGDGDADLVEMLLRAGAIVSMEAVQAAIEASSEPCLAALLRHGPPPAVDCTSPFYLPDEAGNAQRGAATGLSLTPRWTCPILRTLQENEESRDCEDKFAVEALQMLEALLGAGYTPTIYRSSQQDDDQPDFNPLRDTPERFALVGCNKWLAFALQFVEWCPATHHMFPERLKSAFRAVILAATCRRPHGRGPTAGIALAAEGRQHRRRRVAGTGLHAHSGLADTPRLSLLPADVLLRVLQLAASPLSCWVGQPRSGC